MLVKNIEPGAMPAYPVKTGDFNIDLTIAVVAIPDIHKKGNGVLHMLENMPENNTVSMHLGGRCEILLNDVFIRPFVCRVKTGYFKSHRP